MVRNCPPLRQSSDESANLSNSNESPSTTKCWVGSSAICPYKRRTFAAKSVADEPMAGVADGVVEKGEFIVPSGELSSYGRTVGAQRRRTRVSVSYYHH